MSTLLTPTAPQEWIEDLCAAWRRRCEELAAADRAELAAEEVTAR